jgi:hypothetical protein
VSRREITLRVRQCPYCGGSHSYVVEVTLRAIPGGLANRARAQILVACEVDGRSFMTQVDVPIGASQKFVGAHLARYGSGT